MAEIEVTTVKHVSGDVVPIITGGQRFFESPGYWVLATKQVRARRYGKHAKQWKPSCLVFVSRWNDHLIHRLEESGFRATKDYWLLRNDSSEPWVIFKALKKVDPVEVAQDVANLATAG